MSYFVTVLTDTCTQNNYQYAIHTAIYNNTYRTEVYQNNVLIDTVTQKALTNTDISFDTQYTQTHQKIRQQYCQRIQTLTGNPPDTLNVMKSKNTYIVIGFIILASLILLGVLFRTWFIYTDLYINTFYTTKSTKIAYLKTIEVKTHTLNKGCLNLSKKNILPNSIFSTSNCIAWCDKRIITEDTCLLYKGLNTSNAEKVLVSDSNTTVMSSLPYAILPIGDLSLAKEVNTTVQVENLSPYPIEVFVKNISLVGSPHSEIVQFRKAISHLTLNINESKHLVLFLEPSYYRQFKKRRYIGHIEFTILGGSTKKSYIKKFSFLVQ